MSPGAGAASSRTSFADEAVGVELATAAISIACIGALASCGLADSPSLEHAVARNRRAQIADTGLTVALLFTVIHILVEPSDVPYRHMSHTTRAIVELGTWDAH